MKKYNIVSELGYLCYGKGRYTDKFGNVRFGLIYWSDFEDIKKERIAKIKVLALLKVLEVRLFASDIRGVRIKNE